MKTLIKALAFWLALFLYSVYLLSFSGHFHVMDEWVGFAPANNLVQHGRPDMNQFIWTNHWQAIPPGFWGVDNHLYTKKAPGISIITAPLIWLAHLIPGLNVVHVSLLANMPVTALVAALILLWLVDLGFSRKVAFFTALGYGLCTIAWIYARMFWEPAMQALSFLVAVWAAYRAVQSDTHSRWLWILLAGIAVALSLAFRFETVPATGLIGLYLLWEFTQKHTKDARSLEETLSGSSSNLRTTHYALRFTSHVPRFTPQLLFLYIRLLIIYLAPSLLVGLGLMYFNVIRFGSLSETGYNQEILFEAPWVGAFGLLFSPGRGLFIYAPLMLLLFFGIRPAWQRLPRPYFLLIATMCLFYWLFYGSWYAWGGTWGWGPRFLMPILPLLMLFVGESLAWVLEGPGSSALRWAARIAVGVLIALSLFVNFLGVSVDFNEHFLRLGRNDNFVFNWEAFPPLGHWQILQDGLVDIIWLRPGENGLSIAWSILIPALVLFMIAGFSLLIFSFGLRANTLENETLPPSTHVPRSTFHVPRITHYALRFLQNPLTLTLITLITLFLTYQMMLATAQVALADPQAQADLPVLETLTTSAQPGDALHIAIPPFGDVQEISTRVMSYLDEPLPTYAWIESEPRAIQPDERDRIWQTTQTESKRVWLFERWLTHKDPLSQTAARYNQAGFPIAEQWFEKSGKLSLFALPNEGQPGLSLPMNVAFEGGLTLIDMTIFGTEINAGETLKVRLTWQAPEFDDLVDVGLPDSGVISFLHMADEDQNIAQQDRLLLDLQNVERSPLLPGQTISQGYGLPIPDNTPPGSYPLITGLYLSATGERLKRSDGNLDNFLYLTDVIVR
ncbi:MAG: hypothetical protein KDJ65_28385 [Anaerolineae bacterium]|nr:hypothetical protein [Anaerolineae bacterium]